MVPCFCGLRTVTMATGGDLGMLFPSSRTDLIQVESGSSTFLRSCILHPKYLVCIYALI